MGKQTWLSPPQCDDDRIAIFLCNFHEMAIWIAPA
jgi:hypothetical protein